MAASSIPLKTTRCCLQEYYVTNFQDSPAVLLALLATLPHVGDVYGTSLIDAQRTRDGGEATGSLRSLGGRWWNRVWVTAYDPKETSPLRTSAAAMHRTAAIVRITFRIT